MTTMWFDVDGARLHGTRICSGKPLVLVHGTGCDLTVWDSVIRPLAESFDVVAYDRRGHEKSIRTFLPA